MGYCFTDTDSALARVIFVEPMLSIDAMGLLSFQSIALHLVPGILKGWRSAIAASLHLISPATHEVAAASTLTTCIA